MQGEIISLESAKKLFEYEVLKKQIKRINKELEIFKECDYNETNCKTLINKIEMILKEKK